MHRAIYRAIRAGKASEARRLMEQHLHLAESAQDKERAAAPVSEPSPVRSRKASAGTKSK
jgi:GntR family transcriptional repressor for pyruvate dehydrogenase complex